MNQRPTRLLWTIFVVGLLLQIFFFWRSWLSDDQVILLQAGLDFAQTGHLLPVAKGMSGAGHVPGCLLQLLVGIPLVIYPFFKSPNIVVSLFHIAAALLLLDVLKKSMGLKFAAIFLGLYWLSPWRLYHAGFLWEPSYLYLPAAAHLWACWRLKAKPGFWPSVIVGLSVVFTLQVHASFLILLILTGLLTVKRLIKLSYPGLGVGLVVGGLTLLPTIIALWQGSLPPIAPRDGFIGRGLVLVFPALKSLLYWIRFISLDAGGIIKSTVFFTEQWTSRGMVYEGSAWAVKLLYGLALASIAPAAVAAFGGLKDIWRAKAVSLEPARQWIGKYTLAALLAMFISAGLSPVTTQGWHVIIILHAACISGAWWMYEKMKTAKPWYKWTIIAIIALRVPLDLAIGFGHPRYRVTPLSETVAPELITPELIDILPGDHPDKSTR